MPNPVFKRSRSSAERNIRELAEKVENMDYPKIWFQRRKRIFKMMDPNDTGMATNEGLGGIAQRLEKISNMTPDQVQQLQSILSSFWIDVMKDPNAKMPLEMFYRVEYVLNTIPELQGDLEMFIADFTSYIFRIIDTNNDGVISREEWRVWYKCIDVWDEKIADESFDIVDLNKDGTMSKDEFVTAARQYFTSVESSPYDLFFGPLPEL